MASSSAGSSADASPRGGEEALPPLDITFSASWGPPTDKIVFPAFDKLPFRTFSRNSKIGKAADFGGYLRASMRASRDV